MTTPAQLQTMTTALAAAERLKALSRFPDWVARYQRNDPEAIAEFRHLTKLKAAGLDAADESVGSAPAIPPVSPEQAWRQSVDALKADKQFREKYLAGDREAKRQWEELMQGAEHLDMQSLLGREAVEGMPIQGTATIKDIPAPAPSAPQATGGGEQ